MNAQNTIQITNVIELSSSYLIRFFTKAGDIEKIVKQQEKKIILIEFKNKDSVQKAMKFDGRILDKKPISIYKQDLLNKNRSEKKKNTHQFIEQKPINKVPCLHQFKDSEYKIQTRSGYRLVEHSDIQDNQIHFLNNPLEGMKNKGYLWKVILYEVTKDIENYDSSSRQISFSISMSFWALIQLKLRQIQHLIIRKQNQISKYIENFIQEIIINKLTLLKNSKIINNAHRYKASMNENMIEFHLSVHYPEQTEQEAKYLCRSNQKMYNFLCMIYSHSEFLGKIYHELHSSSLILFQNHAETLKLVNKFLDKSSLMSEQWSIKNQQKNLTKNQQKINRMDQEKQVSLAEKQGIQNNTGETTFKSQQFNFKLKAIQHSFSGCLQNYGQYIFNALSQYRVQHNSNALIWLETKNNKIQSYFPYPGFFYCNMLYYGCQGKIIEEKSFYNLYEINVNANQFVVKQSILLSDKVVVYSQGQFSLDQVLQLSLSLVRYELRKKYCDKLKIIEQKKQHNDKVDNQFHSIIFLHSRNTSDDKKYHENADQKIKIDLKIILMGIKFKQRQALMVNFCKQIKKQAINLRNYYSTLHGYLEIDIEIDFAIVEINSDKQNQFNAFNCENYLIDYIDKNFVAKNSIIASEQFALKIAEKILEEVNGHKIFGFKDKKYIGSQIWRLYQKSGVRRVKHKIQQYSTYKKVKLQ